MPDTPTQTLLSLPSRLWALPLSVVAAVGLLAACGDEQALPEDIPTAVQNVLSEEDILRLEALGLVIYRGRTPPQVEGRYLANTVTLVESSFEDPLSPGHRFAPATLVFRDQVGSDLRVEFQQAGSQGEGVGGFISGAGDGFSVYAILDGISNGIQNQTVQIYSGRLRDDGIEDLQIALYMVRKEGDADNRLLIPEATGRLVEEEDGLAERQ